MKPGAREPGPVAGDLLRLDDPRPALAPDAGFPAAALERTLPPAMLAAAVRQRLAAVYRLPVDAVTLIGGVDDPLDQMLHAAPGAVVVFPPSTSATTIAASASASTVIPIAHGWGREEVIDAATAADLPSVAVAWLESPSDPLGSLAAVADVVRLARSCRAVVVDERLVEFAGHSLLPLVAEFENVLALRSLPGGLAARSHGCWLAGSARAAARAGFAEALPPAEAVAAALAALTDRGATAATLRQFRAERSRLFRMVRKFSFIQPVPSWGPFLAARIDLMPRARFVDELAARGIRVHAPAEEGLERFVRIGVGSRSATDRLHAAIRAMAPRVLG